MEYILLKGARIPALGFGTWPIHGQECTRAVVSALAIGYREVLALLDGDLAEVRLAEEIAKNTRALVKKQRTWFRTQLPAHRVLAAAAVRAQAELFAGS